MRSSTALGLLILALMALGLFGSAHWVFSKKGGAALCPDRTESYLFHDDVRRIMFAKISQSLSGRCIVGRSITAMFETDPHVDLSAVDADGDGRWEHLSRCVRSSAGVYECRCQNMASNGRYRSCSDGPIMSEAELVDVKRQIDRLIDFVDDPIYRANPAIQTH